MNVVYIINITIKAIHSSQTTERRERLSDGVWPEASVSAGRSRWRRVRFASGVADNPGRPGVADGGKYAGRLAVSGVSHRWTRAYPDTFGSAHLGNRAAKRLGTGPANPGYYKLNSEIQWSLMLLYIEVTAINEAVLQDKTCPIACWVGWILRVFPIGIISDVLIFDSGDRSCYPS